MNALRIPNLHQCPHCNAVHGRVHDCKAKPPDAEHLGYGALAIHALTPLQIAANVEISRHRTKPGWHGFWEAR